MSLTRCSHRCPCDASQRWAACRRGWSRTWQTVPSTARPVNKTQANMFQQDSSTFVAPLKASPTWKMSSERKKMLRSPRKSIIDRPDISVPKHNHLPCNHTTLTSKMKRRQWTYRPERGTFCLHWEERRAWNWRRWELLTWMPSGWSLKLNKRYITTVICFEKLPLSPLQIKNLTLTGTKLYFRSRTLRAIFDLFKKTIQTMPHTTCFNEYAYVWSMSITMSMSGPRFSPVPMAKPVM